MSRSARLRLAVLVLCLAGGAALGQQTSLRPIIGGLPAGSGFALGLEMTRTQWLGPADARLTAIVSVRNYQFLEAALGIPELGGSGLFLELRGRYRDYPQEDFWGLGPDSRRDRRSNFRFKDVDATATLGVALHPRFRAGAAGGVRDASAGPGRDGRYADVAAAFTGARVPALDRSLDYYHGGLFLEYDSLDLRPDPSSGARHTVRWTRFAARGGERFSFGRTEIDLRQFLPLPGGDRVGLRLYAVFTSPDSGHQVPFFLQPTAGGSDTVRGLPQYRYRDRSALVLNGEYRRALTGFLDGVIFADAGRVFPRAADFAFTRLRPSGGVGLRLKLGGRVFFGMEVAGGGQGARLWFRGDHIF